MPTVPSTPQAEGQVQVPNIPKVYLAMAAAQMQAQAQKAKDK